MVFFGIEVKPGKSFTHQYDKTQGRLHISLANLGGGTNTKKSVLQCNIGNKAPIILSHLYPEKNESCQLHLEFEEEVTFSVVGPRSVHLAGYYIGGIARQNLVFDDDTESCGEDIRETESERSADSSGDEFDDDFIDDGEPEVFPPSPSPGLQDDFVNWKAKKQLPKKRLVIDSSSDDCPQNGDSFWEDEDLPPKTSQNAKTDGLNLLELRNSENKNEERRSSELDRGGAECPLRDDGSKKKKNRKRMKVDSIKNAGDKLNGKVLQDDKNSKNQELLADVDVSGLEITSDNLVVEKLSSGKAGAKVAVDGNKVSIFYCGKLENGEIIESNVGRKPYKFTLGKGQVIEGWDVGISGMQIGEKRRLVIPPSMGFGSRDVGGIPKDSYLHYDIELVDVL